MLFALGVRPQFVRLSERGSALFYYYFFYLLNFSSFKHPKFIQQSFPHQPLFTLQPFH